MKSIILARVSTEEQKEANNSLPAQIRRLEDYCEKKDFQIVQRFSFDESAYKTKRDEFDRVLEYLDRHKEKIAICFDKVDRFSRNVFDKRVPLLYEKAISGEIELHFASDNQVIHSGISAVEKFQFGMSLGLAKYYSDAISDNVKRTREKQLDSGQWPHSAPIGYLNIDTIEGSKDIVPDEERAHLIVYAFEKYASGGCSLDMLAKELQTKGLANRKSNKPVVKSQVDWILKNPFYYGVMICNDQRYDHKYKPLISKTLFDKCEEVRMSRTKTKFKYAAKPFAFRGLIKCAYCGCSVGADRKKDKYTYLSCNQYKGKCGAIRIREEVVSDQILDIFKSFKMPEDAKKRILDKMNVTFEHERAFYKKSSDTIVKEIRDIDHRIEEMYKDKLCGRITADEYDKYVLKFKDQQDDLSSQLKDHIKADKTFLLTSSHIMELANRAPELYQNSKEEQKRQLVNFVLSNLRLEGKKLLYNYKKPFNELALCSKNANWLRRSDSNRQHPRYT